MSYRGMGQITTFSGAKLSTALKPAATTTVTSTQLAPTAPKVITSPTATFVATPTYVSTPGTVSASPSTPMVDVGVDGGIVRSLASALDEIAGSIVGCAGEAWCQKGSYSLVAAALRALRLNQYGRYDPRLVKSTLLALGPERIAYVDRSLTGARSGAKAAMGGYTVSALIADIDRGRYAGRAAPPPPVSNIGKALLSGAMKTAASATNVATKTAPTYVSTPGTVSASPSTPMVDVGVDGGIVRSLASALDEIAGSIVGCAGEAWCQKGSYSLVAAALRALRLNQYGRYDPRLVKSTLLALGPERIAYVDRSLTGARSGAKAAMGGYTVSALIADIDRGRYAGRAAPPPPVSNIGKALLSGAMKTAASATNVATKTAATRLVETQAAANEAAVTARAQAEKAAALAEEARRADEAAKASRAAEVERAAAQVAAEAEASRIAAEETNRIAAGMAAAAEEARRELEAAAQSTNDQPAQEQVVAMASDVAAAAGPLGVPWKVWGVGAAVLVAGYFLMNSKMMSANRRRRVRRNRRRR